MDLDGIGHAVHSGLAVRVRDANVRAVAEAVTKALWQSAFDEHVVPLAAVPVEVTHPATMSELDGRVVGARP